VRLARQLAGILLLGVLLGYPAMACLTSAAAEMTEVERECCKHMAQQCGSMDMPSSHSCCQQAVSSPTSMLQATAVHIAPPVATEAAIIDLANPRIVRSKISFFEVHPPPEGPPGTPSILRI
jgi:hypothetical protein